MVDMVDMIMNMADMEDMDIVHWTIVNVTPVNNWNIQVSLSSSSCIPRGSSDDYILSFYDDKILGEMTGGHNGGIAEGTFVDFLTNTVY